MESIQIVLLKNGQTIITKLSELNNDEGNPLCFLFEVPFVVFTSEKDPETKIGLSKFMSFSKSVNFRIPFNEVLTIGDPQEFILKKYVEIVQPYFPIVSEEAYEKIVGSSLEQKITNSETETEIEIKDGEDK